MTARALLFTSIWGAWAISWVAAALWTDRIVLRRTSPALVLAYALIAASIGVPALWQAARVPVFRVWEVSPAATVVLAVATICGLVFAWWARLHLGRLWSAEIVARADHRIVRSGPYAVVRHPIYTGILAAALATDAVDASAPAALSFACLAAGFRLKAGLEERFLAQEVSDEDYSDYRRRVPMLVPGWRGSTSR